MKRSLLHSTALVLVTLASAGGADAQVVTGVVLSASDSTPVRAAAVSQMMAQGARGTTETDGSGRFRVVFDDAHPREVLVHALGYTTLRVPIHPDSTDGVQILLRRAPLPLAGVDVDAVDSLQITWGPWEVDAAGILRYSRYDGCFFMAMDEVVIRDPRLYLPSAADHYLPGRHIATGHRASLILQPGQIQSQLLRRDASPCGVVKLTGLGLHDEYRPRLGGDRDLNFRREPPKPDAPVYSAVPQQEIARAGDDVHRIAISNANRIVHVPGGSDIAVLDRDGTVQYLDLSAWDFSRVTDADWLGDTLWVADATRGRIALFAPGADEPLVRTYNATATAGPPELAALEMPRPLAGGRWFADLAVPGTYPREPLDPPSTRHLVTMDSAWERKLPLAILRPAPEPLVRGLDHLVQPLGHHTIYDVSPTGEHVTIVRRALDMALMWSVYSVTRLDLQGNSIFHVERTAPLIRVTDDAFDALTEELIGHPTLVREFPGDAVRRTLVRGGLQRPATYYPPISNIVVGRDGTTWLRWPDDHSGTVRWDVLDSAGQPIRTLNLDRRLEIIDADGDVVWGMLPDEAGMHVLTRFTLQPD